MSKIIVFENTFGYVPGSDERITPGYVSIITPSANAQENGLTLDEIAKVTINSTYKLPEDTPYYIIEEEELPNEDFKDAWELTGEWVDVKMSKARVIHMDRIRIKRNEKLDDIDLEIKKAEDNGANVQSLRSKRKILRDIPQTFDLEKYTTPDQLKNAWPEQLKDE